MARYQATLAYDGTDFFGFQRQDEVRTVQGEVETALLELGWTGRSILAAGRTDAGVHASGQVIAFDLTWAHSPEDLRDALNALLPEDAAIWEVRVTDDAFHPRFDALHRRYRYHLFTRRMRDPLKERYAWRVWPELDVERLQEAARPLVGEHDFNAFGAPTQPDGSTTRVVHHSAWQVMGGGDLVYEIVANAFLYHMVRRLVYALVAVGHGRYGTDALQAHLNAPPAKPIQGLAPASGLHLVEVIYP
jgi:tRNA pseudouridine38-40 synthase